MTQSLPKTWLEAGYDEIQIAGAPLKRRTKVNFVAGATAVDNATTGASDVTITGDGNATKLQGRVVASTAPTDGQVLAWNASASRWQPTTGGGVASAPLALVGGSDAVQLSVKAFAGQASKLQTWLSSAGSVVASISAAGAMLAASLQVSGLAAGIAHVDSSGNVTSSSVVNADVNAAAAIAYSKLNLSGSIVNADIAVGANIAATKIAAGSTGQVLYTNGSTQAAWVTRAGDVTGSPDASTVVSLSGSAGIVGVTAGTIRFGASVSTPTLTQANSTSGAGQSFYVQAQAAKSGSAGAGGSVVLQGGAGDGAGATGGVQLVYGNGSNAALLLGTSSDFVSLGASPASAGLLRVPNNLAILDAAQAAGGNIAVLATDGSNHIILGDGTNAAALDLKSAGVTSIYSGATAYVAIRSQTMLGAATLPTTGIINVPYCAGSNAAGPIIAAYSTDQSAPFNVLGLIDTGTAHDWIAIGDSSHTPAVLVLMQSAGAFKVNNANTSYFAVDLSATTITMGLATVSIPKAIASPAWTHAAQTTDVACTDWTFTSQGPWASATGTNRNPGNFVWSVPSPAAGGTAGKHSFLVSGSEVVNFGAAAITSSVVTVITPAVALKLGSSPATTGAVNLTNATLLTWANNGGTTVEGSITVLSNNVMQIVTSGSHLQFVSASNQVIFSAADSTNCIVATMVKNGASTILGWPGQTSFTFGHSDNTTASATAAPAILQGANATGTTATGGDSVLQAGTGTSNYGQSKILGPLNFGRFVQAMSDTNQTVSLANSINNIIETTGALTATRTLTITRPVANASSCLFLSNKCTGAGLTVQFASGGSFSVATGKSAFIYSDGTNCSGFTITT